MEIVKPFRFDKTLFIATLALIATGLMMVFSSSGILASERYNQPFYFLVHQAIGVGVGLIFIFLILSLKKPFYQNPIFIHSLLFFTLALLLICFIMPSVNKTNRWVQFSGLRFQPSELAKISLILFLSSYIERTKEKLNEARTILFPAGILTLFILLIVKEPDFGTAILLFIISVTIFFAAGLKLKYFLILAIIFSSLFVSFLFTSEYRMERIYAFLSPEGDPLGSGFQVIQSKLAVGAGGLFGVSIGESTQKLFFLPCAHTDYIYAIVGEEFGLIGTLTILLFYSIFFWRGVVISSKAPNLFTQLTALGLSMAIFSQALLNISVVLGLSPPTGLPLPLISFGRSSLLCTLFSIGILLHISQRKSMSKNKGKE